MASNGLQAQKEALDDRTEEPSSSICDTGTGWGYTCTSTSFFHGNRRKSAANATAFCNNSFDVHATRIVVDESAESKGSELKCAGDTTLLSVDIVRSIAANVSTAISMP